MWFNNIYFFILEDSASFSGEKFNESLKSRISRGCGQMELSCEGWAKPLGLNGKMLIHETDGRLMFCLRREDKVLPSSLLRERVNESVYNIEANESRRVGRKERMEIKEHLLNELLPKAFVRTSLTYAYIDPKNSWLIVNAAGEKRALELVALLRKTLGTLNIVLPQTSTSPESAMTNWLLNDDLLPKGFEIEDEVELRASGSASSVIGCKHVNVTSEEIRAHVMSGKRVHRMAMNWQGKVSFVLYGNLSMRRIRFDSELIDQNDMGEDQIAQFDADFAVMGAEFSELIPDLLGALDSMKA